MTHKINYILYAGIFVSSTQLDTLKKLIPEDFKNKEGYKEINYPHVTAFFYKDMPIKIVQYFLNHNEENFTIIVDGIGQLDNVIALRVHRVTCNNDNTTLYSINKHQHITLALAGDGKPVEANNIKNWKAIDPITFSGYSRIIYKPKKTMEEKS